MTNSSLQFKTYTPCPSNRKILVADGSLTTVAGLGDIQITSQLTLKNVLHVPKLSTNLLSIQKLTHDLNCVVIFYPTHCEFQDQNTGKMIGRAKEKAGLYYLETENQVPKMVSLCHFYLPVIKRLFCSTIIDLVILHLVS